MASSYKVLSGGWNRVGSGGVEVVVRISVPAGGTNTVAVPWRTALAEWRASNGDTGKTLWPSGTVATLDSGAEHEYVFTHRTNKNRPGVVTELEAAVTAESLARLATLQDILRYWGKEGTA